MSTADASLGVFAGKQIQQTARKASSAATLTIEHCQTELPPAQEVPPGEVQWTEIIRLSSESGWISNAIRHLVSLAALPADWDGAGAAAPNRRAVNTASRVVVTLDELGLNSAEIDPSVENGVCLSFSTGNRYAHIECFNDGAIIAVTSEARDEPNVWEVAHSASSIRATVGRLAAFLS